MKDLEARVKAIEARNTKVEQDKAWEVSWTRRISIAILTYAVIVTYLFVINNSNPWINGAVPAVGFMLSTMAMSWVKALWQRK
jgi:hypothetical protein